ncbi:MAG: TIGR02757 family protein [Chitinophagaceae bacterium]|nr:TIGR02757 family protein [Chitinophagaceae bacterium]
MNEFLKLKLFLDEKACYFNRPEFILSDPVSIPHRFSKLQDIEISGFFAATLAWGNRTSILNSCARLMEYMDHAPYEFVLHHQEKDLQPFLHFKHRTFNATDVLYFIHFFKQFYQNHQSLEEVFVKFLPAKSENIGPALAGFHDFFFADENAPKRTRKHIATPVRNSACKRMNMFLRWMVRKDNCGVDFGLWKKIKPSQLICPCDVHVDRVARKLGLITSKQTNWKTALELTAKLKTFDPTDPVKYDFALFGLGVVEKF